MSMDLRELYQEVIIDHNRNPRNHHALEKASNEARGFNPLCGDKLTVYAHIEAGLIVDLSFVGSGCAISQASASLMTDALKGKTLAEAHELYHKVHHMLTEDENSQIDPSNKLTVLAGVKAYPARVKCASLAWHTLHAALNQDSEVVKTE